jgi:hypothetical protein
MAFVMQRREEFFKWPRRKMGKHRNREGSPVRPLRKAADNVYEDSESERGMAGELAGREESRQDITVDNVRRSRGGHSPVRSPVLLSFLIYKSF